MRVLWLIPLVWVVVLCGAARADRKPSPSLKIKHSALDLAPAGTDWQCAEGDVESICYRHLIECRVRRVASGDATMRQCAQQKNAAVIGFFDVMNDHWNWVSFASMKRCKTFLAEMKKEGADDYKDASSCELVGSKRRPSSTGLFTTPVITEKDVRAFLRFQLGQSPRGAFCLSFRTDIGSEASTCSFTADGCAAREQEARRIDPEPITEKCTAYASVDITPSTDELHVTKSAESCAAVVKWLKTGPCIHLDL